MRAAAKNISVMFLCIVSLFMINLTSLSAQTSEITDGVDYLVTTQNADGSWGDDSTTVGIFSATVSVTETFQLLKETGIQSYTEAVTWLESQELTRTAYLAERIRLLSDNGSDLDKLLSYMDELSLWSGYEDYENTIIDTALSLQALKAIDYEDTETIDKALDYLTTTQNTDFGWGFEEGDESSVFMTSTVLKTLLLFRDTYNFESEITTAASCLLSTHTPEGGFGTTPEETALYETALALRVMTKIKPDPM